MQKNKKPVVVVIGERHDNYNGINTLYKTLEDLKKVNKERNKNDQITYSWGIEGIGKTAMRLKVIKSEIGRHIKPKHFKKHIRNFYELENIMKPDGTMPKCDQQWGASMRGMQARNNIQVGDITAQKTDVIIAVVGDTHRMGPEIFNSYNYKTVPDLLKEQGYTVLDYDATNTVHLNIANHALRSLPKSRNAQDVIKELDKQKANTSQFAEVKQTRARKILDKIKKPLFCLFKSKLYKGFEA